MSPPRQDKLERFMQAQFTRFVDAVNKDEFADAAEYFAKSVVRLVEEDIQLPPRAMHGFFESWLDIFWQMRRPDLMLFCADKASQLFGDDPEWKFARGEGMFYLGEFETAREILAELTYDDVEDPMLYYMLGCLSERMGRDEEAANLFETATRLDEKSFREPTPISDEDAMIIYHQTVYSLPEAIGSKLLNIPVHLTRLPDTGLIQANQPAADPLMVGWLCNDPVYNPNPAKRKEEEVFVLLFTRNMAKAAGEIELIEDDLKRAVLLDAAVHLGFDPDDLKDAGLGL